MKPPSPSAHEDLRRRAAALLASSPGPMSSAALAETLLGMVKAPEAAARAVLDPILGEDERFVLAPDLGWRLAGHAARDSTANAAGTSSSRAWAVWEIDPELRAAAVVRIEDGIVAAERAETIEAHGPSRSRASRGRTLSPEALRRLAACARGARCAHFASRGTVAVLHQALAAAGALSEDGDAQCETAPRSAWLGLPRAALAILGPPRPRSIEALAARLGERIVAADAPLERARAAAACLSRLLEIAVAVAAPGGGSASAAGLGDMGWGRWPSSPSLQAGPRRREGGAVESALDRWPETDRTRTVGEPVAEEIAIRLAARIASLPASAGIYRFLSEDGGLLYVGKAVNLRRRVASYFHTRSTPDPRIAPWIGRVARIEIDETGSEPEALVREAETIIRSAPSANRQRTVHDRPAPQVHSPRRGLASSENVVLLLPARKGGLVHAHLLRRGVPIARVSLGPRGGGTRTLRSLLRRIYFTSGDDSPLAPNIGEGLRGARESRRRRAALFTSWLARQNRPVSAFDPTDAASVDDALAIALRYASGLRRGETGVVYRA